MSTAEPGIPDKNQRRPSSAADVVFTFSYETMADALVRGMMRPPDRLLQTLTVHPRVRRLLVAEPYRNLFISAARDLVARRSDENELSSPVPIRDLIRPRRLRRKDPTGFAQLEREYRRYDRVLQQAAEDRDLTDPLVVTCHPLIAGFAPLEWSRRVLFFVRDDWASFGPRRQWWTAYEEAYRRIRERGHAVCAVSQVVLDRIAPTGPSRVIPNGIAPEEWSEPFPPTPAWFDTLARPRLLYVGSIDDRLDVGAMAQIAKRFPTASVAVVGPMFDREHVSPLLPLSNVVFHDHLARTELRAVILSSDVCLIPHRQTRLTEAMSPLKLFEYLAAGRPVVATDLPPMRGLGDRVMLVPAGGDYASAVAEALQLPPQTESDRQQFVAKNSWRSRHDALLDVGLDVDAPPSTTESES